MKEITVLDEAQLRAEFKATYRDIGLAGCMQVLYELIISANILVEIMLEESKK